MKYTGGAARDMSMSRCHDTHPRVYSPGWKERPNDDMQRITYEKMNEYTSGWVMDGNYFGVLGGSDAFDVATDVICT